MDRLSYANKLIDEEMMVVDSESGLPLLGESKPFHPFLGRSGDWDSYFAEQDRREEERKRVEKINRERREKE